MQTLLLKPITLFNKYLEIRCSTVLIRDLSKPNCKFCCNLKWAYLKTGVTKYFLLHHNNYKYSRKIQIHHKDMCVGKFGTPLWAGDYSHKLLYIKQLHSFSQPATLYKKWWSRFFPWPGLLGILLLLGFIWIHGYLQVSWYLWRNWLRWS